MKDLLIIGAGGMGRETAWLAERINEVCPTWNILGFIDDNPESWGTRKGKYSVLGGCEVIARYPGARLVCAVGASKTRKKIVEKIAGMVPNAQYAVLVDPTVQMSDSVRVGAGSIICANSVITVDISIGNHVIVNMSCTVGHDSVLEDFVMVYPGVRISGNTYICACAEMGTGSQIIQGLEVGPNAIVGAGAVVVRSIPGNCTAVGCPARPIKFV